MPRTHVPSADALLRSMRRALSPTPAPRQKPKHPQYQVPTLDAWLAGLRPVYVEQMTTQELRIVGKTTLQALLAWNESPGEAARYLENINDLQRAALRRFVAVARDTLDHDQLAACRRLGFAD